jgi:acyl-CoA thioesterase-1
VFEALRPALLLGLMLVLFSPLDSQARPRVLVLGDSISAAYGIALEEGWVALLEKSLQRDFPEIDVVNASISGDTSAGGLRRLPPLLATHQPDLLVIELGGTDGLRGYPTRQLQNNLTRMAELGRDAGSQVLILPMEIPPNYGPRYTEAFRQAFRGAADDSGAQLGPFLLQSVALREELMQSDGIHPTLEAQPVLLESVLPAIRAVLGEALGDTFGETGREPLCDTLREDMARAGGRADAAPRS